MQDSLHTIGSGAVGGKANGFWKAKQMLLSKDVLSCYPDFEGKIFFPKTICITTDIFDEFISGNKLAVHLKKCNSAKPADYENFKEAMTTAQFSPELERRLAEIWEQMDYPLAVRSSSLLEDQTGTSFAGKYATVFVSNHGTVDERKKQILTAIKSVFVSVGSPNAMEYRRKHKYISYDEKMAVMIQRAVGREYQGYFFPLLAGVGFSQNEYCWHSEVCREDGLVRLVFGLGTRAVGRGYARLFSPGNPTSRPEGHEAAAIEKYSQATMDVLDIKSNKLKAINFREVIKDGFDCYPGAEKLFSLRSGQTIYVPTTRLWEKEHRPVLTFDAVLSQQWLGIVFSKLIKNVLKVLEEGCGHPVDIEFAGEIVDDSFRLNILQSRPLTQREKYNPEAIPVVRQEKIILTAKRDVPTGSVHDIEYIIYVDPEGYFQSPLADRYTIARVVGNLNRALEGKKFVMIGPGRWGSAKIELGVPVTYAEICNTSMLIEVAHGNYAPEVSFGTHFFQDLIEDNILYVPVFPDEPDVVFNQEMLKSHNKFSDILSDPHDEQFKNIIHLVHIPAIFDGKLAHAILDGNAESGILCVK